MPEGDTVFRTAKMLDQTLAGQMLTRFELRTHRQAPDMVGEQVIGCIPMGKHLLLRIGHRTLHSHLKMEGVWHVYRRGQSWRKPAHKARVVLETEEKQAIGFEIAQVSVIPTVSESEVVGHLGPDVLSPQWNKAMETLVLGNFTADSRPLHVALLDQRNVAGFGNEYANELCFLGGFDPRAAANTLDLKRLIATGRRAIVANCARWERTLTGDTRPGRRHYVYGRARKPCRRCGTPIAFTRLGAKATELRDVYWCPTCQPAIVQ